MTGKWIRQDGVTATVNQGAEDMVARFWGVTAKGTVTTFADGDRFFTFTMDGGRFMTTQCFTVGS